jgi:hypothetical protein
VLHLQRLQSCWTAAAAAALACHSQALQRNLMWTLLLPLLLQLQPLLQQQPLQWLAGVR